MNYSFKALTLCPLNFSLTLYTTMPVPFLAFPVLCSLGRTSPVEGSVWSLRFGCSRQKVQ